jgi:para-aminobenzoate synthetase/4-amino-4-deoxychorismate lyase
VRADPEGLFETMLRAGADLPLLDAHLARLSESAQTFSIPWPGAAELRRLCSERAGAAEQGSPGEAILRLVLDAAGRVLFEERSLRTLSRPLRIVLVEMPVGTAGGAHKRTDRSLWEQIARQAPPEADDAVLVTTDGEVLEATVASVWADVGGAWVTPPLDGRVLPSIGRARTLARLRAAGSPVVERPLVLEELCSASALLLTNAVYGPRPAVLFGSAAGGGGLAAALPVCLRGWPWTESGGSP